MKRKLLYLIGFLALFGIVLPSVAYPPVPKGSGGSASTITFLGGPLSDGTASWNGTTNSLEGFGSITSTVFSDGKITISNGEISGVKAIYGPGDTSIGTMSQTPVIADPDTFSTNFTGLNLYGGTFIANAAGTAPLPAVAVGMNFTYVLEGANANVIDPDGTGTADTIYMNGLAAAQDENIESSTSGAICYFQYRAADTWMAKCTDWTEATPP